MFTNEPNFNADSRHRPIKSRTTEGKGRFDLNSPNIL